MNEVSFGRQVIDRIGFAERWLDRAKRQCEGGDVPQGLLTLLLASAEMTHALRTAQQSAPSRRRRLASGLAAAAAFSVALGALAAWQVGHPASVSSAEAPVIITFNHRIGALLELVEAGPAPMIGATEEVALEHRRARIRTAVRRPLAAGKRAVSAVSSAPIARPSTVTKSEVATSSTHTVPRAAATSVPAEQVVTVPIPSDTELINLVLTAERTLRTQSRP